MSRKIKLIDKPVGFSSFQIVNIFKRVYRKVGHAGTLDPFASGLLIILIDDATKDFISYQRCEKEYTGEILLGMVTDTYDIAGSIIKYLNDNVRCTIALDDLVRTTKDFTGQIEQTPPKFSALKQGGFKLYELSRQGVDVKPKKRMVTIKEFSITKIDYPILDFHVVVGTGAYIRALAHDYGNRLGCGATLLSLKRIRIGEHHIKNAEKIYRFLM